MDASPTPPPAAAVGPELARLRALLDAEQVKLGVSIRQMNSPGSPVYRAVPNVAVPIATLVASLLATIWIHTWVGFGVLLAGAAYWLLKVQPRIKDEVFDRTAALALSGDSAFDVLWARGVLSLYAKLPDGTERAAARRQDWRAFVRDLPGDATEGGVRGGLSPPASSPRGLAAQSPRPRRIRSPPAPAPPRRPRP